MPVYTASKKDRIVEAYIDGLIDRKNRDLRLSKLSDEVRAHTDKKNSLEGRKRAIAGMLEDREKDSKDNKKKRTRKGPPKTIYMNKMRVQSRSGKWIMKLIVW